jgi:hypothetical protein
LTICKEDQLPALHFQSFASKGVEYELTYHKHLLDNLHGSRLLFLAEARDHSKTLIQCVVKFARQYSKEAHEIMAEAGVAADLLYYAWEQTVSLWVVITKYYNCKLEAPL